MRKYILSIFVIIGMIFVNINGVKAICNQTSPDWPQCLENGSSSGGSTGSTTSDTCIDKCNKSDACRNNDAQACAQCKARCQEQANEDKENWEDPTEDFDSDATSNADDTLSDEKQDNVEQSQDITEAQGVCYDQYDVNSEEFLKCIKDATQNPDKYIYDKEFNKETAIGAITDWVNKDEYDFSDVGEPCHAIGDNLKQMLEWGVLGISVVGIILLVILTAVGIIKSIVGSDDGKIKIAFKNMIIRVIVLIILLLLPMLLSFVIDIVNNNSTGEVRIGEDGNVFCDITRGSNSTSTDIDNTDSE